MGGTRWHPDLIHESLEALHHSKGVRRPRIDVPSLGFLCGELDQSECGVAELPRPRNQPRDELLCINDSDPTLVSSSFVDDRPRVKNCKYRGDANGKAQLGRQTSRNVAPIAHGLLEMMRVPVVDTKHEIADPDRRVRMVLGVDRKDSRGPDDQMIYVLGISTNGYRVPHKPARPKLFEHLPDFDFTEGTHVPRPRIIVQPHAIPRLQRRIAGLSLRLHLKTLRCHRVPCGTRRERLDARKIDVRLPVVGHRHLYPRVRRYRHGGRDAGPSAGRWPSPQLITSRKSMPSGRPRRLHTQCTTELPAEKEDDHTRQTAGSTVHNVLRHRTVPLEGLEPPTVSLGRNCSSIELQRLAWKV